MSTANQKPTAWVYSDCRTQIPDERRHDVRTCDSLGETQSSCQSDGPQVISP
jgi:hypothetical protein